MRILLDNIFNPFSTYDNVHIKCYDIEITNTCKKIDIELFKRYMIYSLENNIEFFQNYEVHLVGAFNGTNRNITYDLDFQVIINPIAFSMDMSQAQLDYLDTLHLLYKKQMDISFSKFHVYTDIMFLDKIWHIIDTDGNYMNEQTKNSDTISHWIRTYPDFVKFDNNQYHFDLNRFYKGFTINYNSKFVWSPKQIEHYNSGVKKYDTIIKTVEDLDKIYMPE